MFRFNISDYGDRVQIDVETDCKNIANDDDLFEEWVTFYKDDKQIFNINVYDGWISDFRKKELWLNFKRNY